MLPSCLNLIIAEGSRRRMDVISENIDRFGFTMCDISLNEVVIGQKGVFRTNCLDWQASFLLDEDVPLIVSQSGSNQFCSRYHLKDSPRAISAIDTPRVDTFREPVVLSSRVVGRKWRRPVQNLRWHWGTEHQLYQKWEADIGRWEKTKPYGLLMSADKNAKEFSLIRQKAYRGRTSTISRTRASKLRSTRSWHVPFLSSLPLCQHSSLGKSQRLATCHNI
jgi:hypothetical protein